MPKVRKLTADEVRLIERRIKGQRKLIEEEYDAIIAGYAEGEYGEAELTPNENRITVRNRLKAAAGRSGLSLDFKRTKGNILRFKVTSPNGSSAAAPQPMPTAESDAAPQAPKRGRPPRKKT